MRPASNNNTQNAVNENFESNNRYFKLKKTISII